MTTARALLWLDWRMVRRDFLLLLAIACGATPLLALSRSPGVVLATLAFSLPMICTLLGATLVADPAGLAFLNARAVNWNLVTGLRLAQRCVLAGVTTLVSFTVALVATPDGPALAAWLAEGPSGWFGAAFAVIGFTCSGAALAALVRQPAAAALAAWLLYLMAGMSGSSFASWLLEQWLDLSLRKSSLWILLVPLTVGPALLAAFAAFLFLRERKSAEPRVPWRALAKVGLVLVGVLALLVLPLSGRAAWELHRLHRAVQASPLAAELSPPIEAPNTEETTGWLEERELWHGQPRQVRLAHIGWPLVELRLAQTEDRISLLPIPELRQLLGPVRNDLSLLAQSIIDPSLSAEELFSVSGQLEGYNHGGAALNAALLSHARLLQDEGRPDEARQAFAATWRSHELLLRNVGNEYYLRGERRALELQLRAAMDGLPTPPDLPAKLRALDLRQGVARASLWSARMSRFSVFASHVLGMPRSVWTTARRGGGRLRAYERALEMDSCSMAHQDLATIDSRFRADVVQTLTQVRDVELLAELTARVLEHRGGHPLDTSCRCPNARWVELTQPNGAWSIHLENGPIALRHDEAAPSDTQRE